MKFKLFNRLVVLRNPIRLIKLPDLYTVGFTNRTEDNYFVPVFDYDNVSYSVVKEDADFLQKNFNVGTLVTIVCNERIIQNDVVGSYHLIGFTKFTFFEIKMMLEMVRCDEEFKQGYLRNNHRSWVLRIDAKKDFEGNEYKGKPKLKEVLVAHTIRKANRGIINLIKKIYGVDLQTYFKYMDNNNIVEIDEYLTQKK